LKEKKEKSKSVKYDYVEATSWESSTVDKIFVGTSCTNEDSSKPFLLTSLDKFIVYDNSVDLGFRLEGRFKGSQLILLDKTFAIKLSFVSILPKVFEEIYSSFEILRVITDASYTENDVKFNLEIAFNKTSYIKIASDCYLIIKVINNRKEEETMGNDVFSTMARATHLILYKIYVVYDAEDIVEFPAVLAENVEDAKFKAGVYEGVKLKGYSLSDCDIFVREIGLTKIKIDED